MIEIRLYEILEERGISILEMSKALGIRYTTVYNIVHQRVDRVNLKYLYAMMDYLQIDDMNEVMEIIHDYDLVGVN